ncbi:hypothetical protein N9Y10_00845 [Flavobacteriaceae bacterium]|nr:hypothetical protein [Flavobacteriaceae bacterium]
MKTILLYARSLQTKFYGLIGLEIEDNYNTIYLVQNNQEYEILLNLNCKGKIYNIQDFIQKNWYDKSMIDSVNLEDFENEYDISSLWQIFYTDRFLYEFKYEDSHKIMKLLISLFLIIFSENKPDIFVNEEIAIFPSYLMYFFCKKHNAKYLGLGNPRQIGDKKTALVNGPQNNFYHLDEMYQKGSFTSEQLKEAEAFIDNFRKKEIIPPYMLKGTFSKKKPKLSNAIKSLLRYGYHSMKSANKSDYMRYFQVKIHLREASFYFKFLRQKKHYLLPDFSEKYYYFPLHYQPEASTLVAAPNYEKQQYAMDLLAKKIPVGAKLYIKEHFSVLGHREMIFYKSLKKYPNVKLISPWENSHQLIKNSEGVITLTGTAGWETVLYGKPVFVIGNVFYRSFKYTNVIDNINDLSDAIKNHKTKKLKETEYRKELIQYVAAYINSSKEGVAYLNDKNLLKETNVKNLTKIIINELD